jgi:hypothetical protein
MDLQSRGMSEMQLSTESARFELHAFVIPSLDGGSQLVDVGKIAACHDSRGE